MEKDTNFDNLLSLPLEEYQRELGQLLAAAINIAAEERPKYREKLVSIKTADEDKRTVVVK